MTECAEVLCACGCGQPTPIATATSARYGHRAGEPTRFRQGHTNHRHIVTPGYRGSIRERILRKIDVDAETGCWLWTARRSKAGYGEIAITDDAGHRKMLAHRVAYEVFTGPIPEGLLVRHRCDTPPCVNPAHLELGTTADNIADMWERGRASPPPH